MGALIYSAIDLSTDMHVVLEHTPNAWVTWTVTVSSATNVFPSKAVGYDSLVSAAHATVNATELFEDVDAPDAEAVLTAIVEHFDDEDKIYLMSEEPNGGGIYLVNEHEWDED